MNGHLNEEMLNDYADDALPEPRRLEVERHLSVCADCRRAHQALAALLQTASTLPPSRNPARDLWLEIGRRIGDRPAVSARIRPAFPKRRTSHSAPAGGVRRGQGARLGTVLMAAVVLLTVGVALLLAPWDRDRPLPPQGASLVEDSDFAATVLAAVAQIEADYESALEAYLAALAARRDELAPETVAVIEDNLRIIDEALEEIRTAINIDPGSDYALIRLLASGYQAKLDILRRAVQSPATDDPWEPTS